jgi:hypothetical protein
MFVLLFLLVGCLPYSLGSILGLSSITIPFLACLVLFYSLLSLSTNALTTRIVFSRIQLALLYVILLSSLLLIAVSTFNISKALFTLGGLVLMFFFINSLQSWICDQLNTKNFIKNINILNSIFVLIGILGFFNISLFGFEFGNKQILFFSEPSHYFTIYTPIFAFVFFTFILSCQTLQARVIGLFYYCLPYFSLAIFLRSATALAYLFLIFLCYFMIKYLSIKNTSSFKFSLFNVALLSIVSVATLYILNIKYFSARYSLDVSATSLSEASSNISFLSGLERGFNTLALMENFGLGYGFQQMNADIVQVNGFYTNSLLKLTDGVLVNSYDGSIMFSKLLVEHGYLGLIFSIFVVLVLYKRLKLVSKSSTPTNVFAFVSVLSLFGYTFIRGGGYISFPVLLFFLTFDITEYSFKSEIRSSTNEVTN